jgi:hypothetical protein
MADTNLRGSLEEVSVLSPASFYRASRELRTFSECAYIVPKATTGKETWKCEANGAQYMPFARELKEKVYFTEKT